MGQNPGSQPTREPSSLGVTGGNGGNPLKKNIKPSCFLSPPKIAAKRRKNVVLLLLTKPMFKKDVFDDMLKNLAEDEPDSNSETIKELKKVNAENVTSKNMTVFMYMICIFNKCYILTLDLIIHRIFFNDDPFPPDFFESAISFCAFFVVSTTK